MPAQHRLWVWSIIWLLDLPVRSNKGQRVWGSVLNSSELQKSSWCTCTAPQRWHCTMNVHSTFHLLPPFWAFIWVLEGDLLVISWSFCFTWGTQVPEIAWIGWASKVTGREVHSWRQAGAILICRNRNSLFPSLTTHWALACIIWEVGGIWDKWIPLDSFQILSSIISHQELSLFHSYIPGFGIIRK